MSITPHIVVQRAGRAAGFYRDAFGTEEVDRIPTVRGVGYKAGPSGSGWRSRGPW